LNNAGRAARAGAIGAFLTFAMVTGSAYRWDESRYISTDDAFIDPRIAEISPRVAGQLIAVPVTDNQRVRREELPPK
jgi:membrane fusion protein, multidrug efflux system